MTEIFAIAAILMAGQFWWSAMRARELALNAVMRYCRKMQLALLDDCVALTATWLKRDQRGKWQLWRRYSFEFTVTGYERYQGQITLLGQKIERIITEPYRIIDDPDSNTLH